MLTNAFIRDLREAIGDVIDEHADIFAELRGGLDLCTDMTEGAILAAQRHLSEASTRPGNGRPDLVCVDCGMIPDKCDCPSQRPSR